MTESRNPSSDEAPPAAQEMEAELPSAKRGREDGEGEVEEAEAKKQKSAEEEEEAKPEEEKAKPEEEEAKPEEEEEEERNAAEPVALGTKVFHSSEQMFDYFYKFLHAWPTNVDVNKYEHLMLLELLKKGYAEPEKKIGSGIRTFQVRKHPTWKSRCFFLVREDGFVDDFSFRKCVDCILPLPENMKLHNRNNNGNKKSRGHHRGGRARGRGGRGRHGGSRT